jgi:hypothetical protein
VFNSKKNSPLAYFLWTDGQLLLSTLWLKSHHFPRIWSHLYCIGSYVYVEQSLGSPFCSIWPLVLLAWLWKHACHLKKQLLLTTFIFKIRLIRLQSFISFLIKILEYFITWGFPDKQNQYIMYYVHYMYTYIYHSMYLRRFIVGIHLVMEVEKPHDELSVS